MMTQTRLTRQNHFIFVKKACWLWGIFHLLLFDSFQVDDDDGSRGLPLLLSSSDRLKLKSFGFQVKLRIGFRVSAETSCIDQVLVLAQTKKKYLVIEELF